MTLTIVLIGLTVLGIILLLVLVLRSDSGSDLKSEINRLEGRLENLNLILAKTEQAIREEARANREEIAQALKNLSDSSCRQMADLTQLNEQKLENIRQAVESNLRAIQEENSKKLEQMRAIVDEKLQSTLEKRLGESFTQVSERLESVYKGLGEMQKLAGEVGNLKNVLSNINIKGVFGEIQLERIIEQLLTPEQYGKKVKIDGNEVEFAIRLPGKDDEVVWLPIDSKLPLSEYERLLSAQEQLDKNLVEECSKALETAIKLRAKEIKKYILPPKTTDFAIMFLPIESLYAEVLRRPGLFESLQSQHKIVITGPTTLSAFLNSLQMGFKTLAIEKRATEVWKLLGAVKTDFGKFNEILEGLRKNLDAASNKIEEATKRTRIIGKKLKEVQALPASETENILGPAEEMDDETG